MINHMLNMLTMTVGRTIISIGRYAPVKYWNQYQKRNQGKGVCPDVERVQVGFSTLLLLSAQQHALRKNGEKNSTGAIRTAVA